MISGLPVLRSKKAILGLAAAICAAVLIAVVSAGVASRPQPAAEAEAASMTGMGAGGTALRVIGSVALLIGVLYAGVYVMRSLSGRGSRAGIKDDAVAVLHRKHLAPKKAIYVVRIAGRSMVLGVTDSQISHLADLTDQEISSIRTDPRPKPGQFRKHLEALGIGIRSEG
jgi:flagellar protein FliO/FliZ